MTALIILGIFALLFAALITYVIMVYNGLIRLKNETEKSWSNIDILLKQRFDELPKLIKVCEGYMQHEKNTLEAVIKARSMVGNAKTEGDQLNAQNMLTDTLKSLFAVTERYPDLKADAAFTSLGHRISELEDQIADRREFFNEYINLYNIRIAQFPDVLIANKFNFGPKKLWEINPEHRQDVQVSFSQS